MLSRDTFTLGHAGGRAPGRAVLSSLGRPLAATCFLGLAALVACGGSQLGNGVGGGGGGGGGSDGGVFTEPDGAVCVDIDLSSYDQSCAADSDCIEVNSGVLCSAGCLCGGSTINKSGEARYNAAIAELPPVGRTFCECPFFGNPECLNGTCTICDGPSGAPACSSDGGITVTDSSTGDETIAVDAKGPCVDINPASYTQSCSTAGDCTLIQTGEVCSGSCNCGAYPINVSGEAQYAKATSGITFEDCPCIDPGPLECIGGTCTLCSGSPPPKGCPDAG